MECGHCGQPVQMERHCSRCDMVTCTAHILPENHGCEGPSESIIQRLSARSGGGESSGGTRRRTLLTLLAGGAGGLGIGLVASGNTPSSVGGAVENVTSLARSAGDNLSSAAEDAAPASLEERKGEKLREETFSDSFITKIEFFGASVIEVHFREDHNRPSVGFVHDVTTMGTAQEPLEDAYKVYDTPQFSGPATYGIGGPIINNGPFPDNRFKMKVADPEKLYVGLIEEEVSFLVPPSYVSGETPVNLPSD